ncbi:unnamed protein product [Sphagnum balticum]
MIMSPQSCFDLIEELKNARERGGILRALLAESPSNLNALESAKGPEAKVLQSEIARVTEKYKKLKAKAERACANSDKLKKVTIRALAVWEILTDHVSGTHLELKQLMKSITPGKNSVGTCRTMTRMQMEANATLDLFKLLQTKEQLLEGGVKYLTNNSREQLQLLCRKGLSAIQERQAKVFIPKALQPFAHDFSDKNCLDMPFCNLGV